MPEPLPVLGTEQASLIGFRSEHSLIHSTNTEPFLSASGHVICLFPLDRQRFKFLLNE